MSSYGKREGSKPHIIISCRTFIFYLFERKISEREKKLFFFYFYIIKVNFFKIFFCLNFFFQQSQSKCDYKYAHCETYPPNYYCPLN